MSKYTVVLLRSQDLCDEVDEDFGTNSYTAFVEADSTMGAVLVAQKQAMVADKKDGFRPDSTKDYIFCLLFEGWHEPKLFGWQSGPWNV